MSRKEIQELEKSIQDFEEFHNEDEEEGQEELNVKLL